MDDETTIVVMLLMITVVVIVLGIALSGMKIILPNERGIYTRMGRVVRVLQPGMNFVTPMIGEVTKISVAPHTVVHEAKDMITNDQGRITLTLMLEFAVADPLKVYTTVTDYSTLMVHQGIAEIAASVAAMKKDDVLGHLNTISDNAKKRLKETGFAHGVEVLSVRVVPSSETEVADSTGRHRQEAGLRSRQGL